MSKDTRTILIFLGEKMESCNGVLDAIITNGGTKKDLLYILGEIGRDDLKQKVIQYFLNQSKG